MSTENPLKSHVVKLLGSHRSLPFLEIATVTGARHEDLAKVVKQLEAERFVRRDHPGDILEEIVTIRERS